MLAKVIGKEESYSNVIVTKLKKKHSTQKGNKHYIETLTYYF